MGLVALIGGFLLLAVLVGVTVWSKAKTRTPGEQRAADQATRDLYGKNSQSND